MKLKSIPIQENGHQYSRVKAMIILSDEEYEVADAMKQMIDLKYVPCGKSALYQMIKARNKGKLILGDWSFGGRHQIPTKRSNLVLSETTWLNWP